MVQWSPADVIARVTRGKSATWPPPLLMELSRTSRDAIPRTDYASVSIRYANGLVQTMSATDDVIWPVATLQDGLGEGPGYDVVTDRLLSHAGDLTTSSSWPTYGPKAAALGVRSHLAMRIHDESGARVGLNLYSRDRDAFGHPEAAASVLMGYARAVLTGADDVGRLALRSSRRRLGAWGCTPAIVAPLGASRRQTG